MENPDYNSIEKVDRMTMKRGQPPTHPDGYLPALTMKVYILRLKSRES
jgi:hypothetical protein